MACRLLIIVIAVSISRATAQEVEWEAPLTEDDHIDLQGVWVHDDFTPLQRPSNLRTLLVTQAEVAALESQYAAEINDRSRPGDTWIDFKELHFSPIRGELRSSIVFEPADGKIPANALFVERVTYARSALLSAFDGPEQRPPAERCLSSYSAGPPGLASATINLRMIVQTQQAIAITYEEKHETRIIRINASHTSPMILSWLGSSIGWWENDTLVVETKNFAPSSELRAAPLYLVSPQTTVTERFRRVSADKLSYVFTVEDPTYYTQPWKGETAFSRSTAQLFEYACHEGNYSLYNVLRGARSQEASAAAK